ncbi:MAG: hypothetical protein ACRC5C_15395 [Bacilli bacterium]
MTREPFSPQFVIGSIRIGVVETSSCLNFGNNFPTNFQSHKKSNQGLGTVIGDRNHFDHVVSALNDADEIDTIDVSGAKDVPDWLKGYVKKKQNDQVDTECVNQF